MFPRGYRLQEVFKLEKTCQNKLSAYVFRFIWNLHTQCQGKKLPETPEHKMLLSRGPLAPQELGKTRSTGLKKAAENAPRPPEKRRSPIARPF